MIDTTKLSRDYKLQPLGSWEDISKEDLEYLYNDSGLTKTDICKYLPCSTAKLYRLLKKYNINKKVNCIESSYLDKIDWKRLRRNYIDEPLKYKEKPTKEEVEYLYLELLFPKDIISRIFGRGNSERFTSKLITEYQIKLPMSIAVKRASETYEKRTGYKSPLSNPAIHKKAQETCLNKYGVNSWMKTQAAKDAQGVLFNTKEQIEKAKITRANTNLKRYGVDNPLKLETYQQKQRETFLQRYNATSYPQSLVSKEVLELLSEPGAIIQLYTDYPELNTEGISELLGVASTTLLRYIHQYNLECLVYKPESSFEREIRALFPTINFRKDRTILNGKEIDLYAPDYKIGIEFNGNYWHSDAHKTPLYHRNKSNEAAKMGVFLFHIFEYEWTDQKRKQAIINRLHNLFSLNDATIYARNCQCKTIDEKTVSEFLDNNHVQGSAYAPICLGLFYKGELVSVMTFSTNKLDKDHQYELTRLCSQSGVNVVGGASKLFKHFVNIYKPVSIVSYSDNAKSTGGIYNILNFKHIDTTYPQYHWTDGKTTLTRYRTQRKQLIKLGWMKPGDSRSESEVMREHGYFKIYDCGKKVWSWINPKTII